MDPRVSPASYRNFDKAGARLRFGGKSASGPTRVRTRRQAAPSKLPPRIRHRFNSPSRARTYDLAVNSRSLYLLSYRGIHPKVRPSIGTHSHTNQYRQSLTGFPLPCQDLSVVADTEKPRRDGQGRAHGLKWVVCVFCAKSVRCGIAIRGLLLIQGRGSVEEFEEHGQATAHLLDSWAPSLDQGS